MPIVFLLISSNTKIKTLCCCTQEQNGSMGHMLSKRVVKESKKTILTKCEV